MATTIVKTIGSGGDYTGVQQWDDAAPVDLVTANQIWQGQCLNQNISLPAASTTISGSTTNTSCYKELTTAPGASFRDQGNVPLNINTTAGMGASLVGSTGTEDMLYITEQNVRVNKLQIYTTNTYQDVLVTGNNPVLIDSCIIKSAGRLCIDVYATASVVSNCLIFTPADSLSYAAIKTGANPSIQNCTIIRSATGGTSSRAFNTGISGSKPNVTNVAVFGFAGIYEGDNAPTATACYTEINQSGWTKTTYDTTTGSGFYATGASGDFRLKDTSVMINKGTNTSYGAFDIVGKPRTSGLYDIGCWEYAPVNVTHTTSGSVVGLTTNVSGSAKRFKVLLTSGVVTGEYGNVIGDARRFRPVTHTTDGIITGTDTLVVGTATKIHIVKTHATSGVVTGFMATVTGKAINGFYNTTQRSTTAVPYSPAPPPTNNSSQEQLTRSVWDELHKLRDILASIDLPNLLTVTSKENINIGQSTTVPVWNRLFNENPTVIYSMPTGTFSPTTGTWTAPQEGIYQISCQITLPKDDQLGNNNYYAQLRCTVDPFQTGQADTVFSRVNGGNEEVPISVTLISAVRCFKGDRLTIDLAAVNTRAGSTALAENSLTIIRQSGLNASAG